MSLYTVDKMSDTDLVATVLGMQADKEVCARLATAMTTEGWLSGGQLADFVRESGVGDKRIARLEASVELGRRALAACAARKTAVISKPEDVVALVKPLLVGQSREHFFCACLGTKNHLRRLVEVSVGSLSASIVHPRELFREAIAVSAASVVVCHGHPSGDPSPSGADVSLTKRLCRAGDVLGIEVLDHVVIGGDTFVSMRDAGLM